MKSAADATLKRVGQANLEILCAMIREGCAQESINLYRAGRLSHGAAMLVLESRRQEEGKPE